MSADNEALLQNNRFSPRFLTQLQAYRALRFMDWMRPNKSVVSTWSMRAKRSDSRYSTAKGVPAEVMIELANATQKAPWFTMPHAADDGYVRAFAELTKTALNPSLDIFIEYSNEGWNSAFSQGDYIQAKGQESWPGGSESAFTKRINWYGRRSAEVCDIWRSVFRETPNRINCIISSQAANAWTASAALSCPLWDEAPCANHGITSLAIAPYIGDYLGQEDSYPEVLGWSNRNESALDTLFSELTRGGARLS